MNAQPNQNSSDEAKNLRRSAESKHQDSQRFFNILNRSIPGQYLAMLLALHSAFIALAWLLYSSNVITRFMILSAAFWAMARALGAYSGWLITPVVTLAFMIMTLLFGNEDLQQTPSWLISSIFSKPVLILIIGIVLIIDFLELAESHGQKIAKLIRQYGLRILRYGIAGSIAIYSIIVPIVQELIYLKNPPSKPLLMMDRLSLPMNMLFKFVESFTGLMFLTLGAVVGSFLNVVIYRLPHGISVVSKRSHCPKCQAEIQFRDNLPLIGWLRLNGQCRNCNVDISARYPIVEGIIGFIFLLLFFVELISGGTNLPERIPNTYAGVQWILLYTKWDLVGLYVYHTLILCILFTWAMIRRDGYQVPLKSTVVMFALIIFSPLILPHLLPLQYNFNGTNTVTYTVFNTAITSLIGLCTGGIISMLPVICGWGRQTTRPSSQIFDRPSWLVIGAGLGWQAVIGVFTLLVIWMICCSLIVWPELAAGSESKNRSAMIQRSAIGIELKQMALPCVLLIHHCLWCAIAELFVI